MPDVANLDIVGGLLTGTCNFISTLIRVRCLSLRRAGRHLAIEQLKRSRTNMRTVIRLAALKLSYHDVIRGVSLF